MAGWLSVGKNFCPVWGGCDPLCNRPQTISGPTLGVQWTHHQALSPLITLALLLTKDREIQNLVLEKPNCVTDKDFCVRSDTYYLFICTLGPGGHTETPEVTSGISSNFLAAKIYMQSAFDF